MSGVVKARTQQRLIVALLAFSAPVFAAQSPTGSPAKRAFATRTEEPPDINGKLDDAAWEQAEPISDFVQHEPREGQPPTERTEIRILYDASYLYIGVRCFDTEPSRILVSESQRDADLTDTDAFWMVLDTFHDKRNAFVFGTNPFGIEFDGQVANDGGGAGGSGGARGPGQSITERGTGGDFNKNWDGTWRVRAAIDAEGWTAEFAIPLTTLRFPDSPTQLWGINFARNIRRKNEQVYWASVPRQWDLYRVSLAGELHGLALQQPRNLRITPYVLGSARRDYTIHTEVDRLGEWGGDLKYSITPNLTLDLTYNTDFAQVEVDEQQVNLTRFNLFFPEKRPFFLENAGFFAVGSPGQVDMFFSRRIGLDSENTVIPILGGARLSGKVGGWNLGLLDMQTDERGPEGTNFLVTRVNRQLGERSSFGGIFINKQGTGREAQPDLYNRTMALDGRLGLSEFVLFRGFVARTVTADGTIENEGSTANGVAYNFGGSYTRRTHSFNLNYTEVGEDFNPEVGFLERRAFRKINGGVNTHVRLPSVKWLRQLGPHVTWRRYMGIDGFFESETVHMDMHVDWNNGMHFSPAIDLLYEGVREPFELFPGVVIPPGSYRHPVIAWRFNSNMSAPLAIQLAVDAGGFYNGRLNSYRAALNWRYSSRFAISGNYTRNNGRFPVSGPNQEFGGDFSGDLFFVRANYSFTPRIYLQSLLQYNDVADNWSVNLRFGWLNAAGTGLFVVYNETQDLEGVDYVSRPRIPIGGPVNRALIVKFTWEFRIFE